MGRYYSGDIEGKFWVGVQSSTDASFFGGEEYEPQTVEYYFDKTHIDGIVQGIEQCQKELGENEAKLDKFFETVNGYNDQTVTDQTGIQNVHETLVWYSRLQLGKKILSCVTEKGECRFTAEL